MSLIKFLTKRSTVLCLGITLLLLTFVPMEAFAAMDTGPFQKFLKRAATLFMQTRNALFVVAVFSFIVYGWTAIMDGKVDWKKLAFLIIGLVLLGVAGWTISYLVDPSNDKVLVSEFQDTQDMGTWNEK